MAAKEHIEKLLQDHKDLLPYCADLVERMVVKTSIDTLKEVIKILNEEEKENESKIRGNVRSDMGNSTSRDSTNDNIFGNFPLNPPD